MNLTKKQAVVIGGGMTGLAAAYRLMVEAKKRSLALDVKLLEASERVGGVVRTTQQDGFVVEHGPDAFISTKPWAKALCEELGITDEFIGTNPKERRSFILRKGRLHPVPEGFYLMAPGSLWPFVKTPIFSWPGKLRMALDLVIPPKRDDVDESLEGFVTRRLGREAFVRMAQPMIGGIYTADAKDLSLHATMPQFIDMEREHGSIIRALLARKKQAQQQGAGTSGPRYSLFLSFKTGMQTLVDTLVSRLPEDCIQLGAKVNTITYRPDREVWRVQLADASAIEADLLCLALPAYHVAALIKSVAPELADHLSEVPYASSITVNLGFQRKQVAHPLNGMGFVVPAIEKRAILACSFSSIKYEGRAPHDQALLRAFMGGAIQSEQFEQSETDIIETALRELRDLLGIEGDPTLAVVSKHAGAMAQYHLGHLERVAQIETLAEKLPRFALAGNAFRGIGVPDCINSADKAAKALLAYIER